MMRHCVYLLAALAAVGGGAYLIWPDPPAARSQPNVSLRTRQLAALRDRAEEAAPPRPRVMLLGCGRAADGGPAFDPRAADAAKQVADVVERLEQFRPTRVLVERPATSRPDDLDAEFRAFAAGQPAATPDRQIGFALARRLGHDRVYGLGGAADDEPAAGLQPGTRAASRGRRRVATERRMRMGVADVPAPGLALRNHLIEANDPPQVRRRYGAELVAAAAGDPAGAAAGEHRRRLRMFAAVRAAAGSGERVLAVVGAGPLGVLRLCAEGCPEFDLIEAAPYLAVPVPVG